MRRVTINNFRCYESKSIDFRRGINLLIGDNSVGKTSLLRACNLVMNAFFCGYSDENTKWKSAEDDDFREIKNDDVATDELPINIAFELDETDCPDITLEGGTVRPLYDHKPLAEELGSPKLNIEKKSKKNARNLITGLIPLRTYASLLQKNSHAIIEGTAIQRNALPLFAYFTTEDIHTVRKFDKEKRAFKKYPQKPSLDTLKTSTVRDCWIAGLNVCWC